MIGLGVQLDSKEAKDLLVATAKSLRTTVRRGMGEASSAVIRQTRPLIDAGENAPWFQRRRRSLLKQYATTARRMIYNMANPGSIIAESRPPSSARKNRDMATAVELGAPHAYQQFVHESNRRRRKVFGRPVSPFVERVSWHLRMRRMRSGKWYLNRAVDAALPDATRVMNRALEVLITEGRAPTRAELRAP